MERLVSELGVHGVGWEIKEAGCLGEFRKTGEREGWGEEQRSEHHILLGCFDFIQVADY